MEKINKLIQSFEEEIINVKYHYDDSGFIISTYFGRDIFTGFTYVNSTNKIFLHHHSIHGLYRTSSNRERKEFIGYLEKEFKIIIKRTNLDNE